MRRAVLIPFLAGRQPSYSFLSWNDNLCGADSAFAAIWTVHGLDLLTGRPAELVPSVDECTAASQGSLEATLPTAVELQRRLPAIFEAVRSGDTAMATKLRTELWRVVMALQLRALDERVRVGLVREAAKASFAGEFTFGSFIANSVLLQSFVKPSLLLRQHPDKYCLWMSAVQWMQLWDKSKAFREYGEGMLASNQRRILIRQAPLTARCPMPTGCTPGKARDAYSS